MTTALLLVALLSQDVTKDLENADAALNSGDFDTAIGLYTKAFRQDPKQVECLVGRSRAKLGKKDFDGAIDDATLAIKSGLQNSHVFVYRAMAKYGKKAEEKVERAMHERKRGTLRSGRSGQFGSIRRSPSDQVILTLVRASGRIPCLIV